ncbi:outer membrane lipoprotein-sorting protein [Salinisphaera sp. PC39]|uniref:outer membrane lipoprotein-sorting protein n=1 Tax=Salinisphaera sp. PC39 TaxID=1304156 RepID=UPI00333FDC6F
MNRHLFTAVLAAGLLGPTAALAAPSQAIENADQPGAKGRAIVEAAEARRSGFGDYRAELEMTLRDPSGREATRRMRIRTLERPAGDWSLIVFKEPKDVEGTALLTHSYATRPDDQWLYLPALKRVKRIASNNKSGPFMGSEFAYEDLSSQEVEKYTDYRYLGDASVDGVAAWKVERRPAYENSGYTRQVAWIGKDQYRLWKVTFYDRKNALLKTLTVDDYERYLEEYWYPHTMVMDNHQTGKSTVLHWRNYRFRNGYTERDFDRNALKRAR